MPKPFYNEETVQAGDETFRLVLNFRAIDAIETLLKPLSFDSVLEELTAAKPRLSLIGKVLWGLLREHHPEVTLDETASLMFGDTGMAVGIAVHKLLEASFPTAEPQEEKGENPPKRRGASKPSS